MSIPSEAVEVPPDSDEPPDYQRADGTPGYLLRVYTTPIPPLVFTIQTKGRLTGPEIKVEKEAVPVDDEILEMPWLDGSVSRVSWKLVRAAGFYELERRIRAVNPSLKQRAEKIAKITKIARVYREHRSRHPQWYPPPPPPPVCRLCDKPVRDMFLHELIHDLDREQEERLEYAAILDGRAE